MTCALEGAVGEADCTATGCLIPTRWNQSRARQRFYNACSRKVEIPNIEIKEMSRLHCIINNKIDTQQCRQLICHHSSTSPSILVWDTYTISSNHSNVPLALMTQIHSFQASVRPYKHFTWPTTALSGTAIHLTMWYIQATLCVGNKHKIN